MKEALQTLKVPEQVKQATVAMISRQAKAIYSQ
jgi:hypothetical protein